MKIVVNSENNDLLNAFIKAGKEKDHQIFVSKMDQSLFEHIESCDVDAFVLSNESPYFKKAVEFIKKKNPYIPIVGCSKMQNSFNVPVDIYMSEPLSFEGLPGYYSFALYAIYNIETYIQKFTILQRLTAKMQEKIEFVDCVYDPTRRLLYYKDKEIKKLSIKEGGILEILASNYGQVVKKEVILERVWRKTDYFVSRSMDVYLSYLRNIFRENEMNIQIKNISGIGLILE